MDMVYIEQFSILRDLQLIFSDGNSGIKNLSLPKDFEGDLSTSKYEFIGFNKYEMENRENETDL